MMYSFIRKTAANLLGMELAPTPDELKKLRQQQIVDNDDEYEDPDDDDTAMIM